MATLNESINHVLQKALIQITEICENNEGQPGCVDIHNVACNALYASTDVDIMAKVMSRMRKMEKLVSIMKDARENHNVPTLAQLEKVESLLEEL